MNGSKLWVVLSLCAAVSASAAETSQPIRLASPGFTGVNVDDKVANFFSEHFAQKLALSGITVISSSEVAALVGLERQKQLMGCNENASTCLTELANAMGADGVITGSIGKFGNTFQVNLKILSANNATALSIISKKAFGEEDLLKVLEDSAELAASDLKEKLGRTGTASTVARTDSRTTTSDTSRSTSDASRSTSDASRQTPAVSQAATSQSAAQPRLNNVTFWAIGPLAGTAALEYERAVVPLLSIFVAPSYMYYAYTGEVRLGARLYPFGLAPEGLFIAADLKPSFGEHGFATSVGGGVGYTTRLFSFVAASVGFGGGYYLVGSNPNAASLGLTNYLDMHARLNVGVAF